MNQLKSVYNIPFWDAHSHPIHTCLSMIASNKKLDLTHAKIDLTPTKLDLTHIKSDFINMMLNFTHIM